MPVTTVTLVDPAFDTSRTRRSGPRARRQPRRLVAAAVGAALVSMAFPPVAWWWTAPIGVALVVLSVSWGGPLLRHAAGSGAVAGAVFASLTVSWMQTVAPEAVAALVALLAFWWVLLFVLVAVLARTQTGHVWIPGAWVLIEVLRSSVPFGGFPWARLGFAAVDSPWQWLIPYLGVYGMSLVLAAVGTCLAVAVRRFPRRPPPTASIVGVVLLALAVIGAAGLGQESPAASDSITAAVVQGGPQPQQAGDVERRAVLTGHAEVTRKLAEASSTPPDLVLWPENAADLDPTRDAWAKETVDRAVAAVGAPVVVGAVTEGSDASGVLRNQAIVWRPGSGPGAAYTKSRLVPFGEYVPLRSALAPVFPSLSRVGRDMEPGQGPPILDVGRVRAGVLICYEVAFDDVAREAVQGGAQLLLVPSNNATYAGTAQPLQQLGIERFRALEARRAVLVASTTGVSAMIQPDGAVVRSIGDGGSGWLLGRVPLSEEITPASRFGGVVGVLVAVLTALAVIVTALPRSRKASKPTRGASRRTHRQRLSS